MPRWKELQPLLRPRPFIRDAVDRRLARAETVAALRKMARGRVPRAVFDYTDGAAGEERSLRRNRELLESVSFRPRVLRDVSVVDTSAKILGEVSALPIGLAPTGFTRMMNHEGEAAVARAARRHGVPYALSTMGTTSIEEVARAAPGGRKWFQLYLWRDREASIGLIDRAARHGYEALVLTVDTPVAGPRLRDVRNGFTIPPTLTARTVVDAARKPRWWFDLLTTEPLQFASLSSWSGTVADLANSMFDPSATLADLEWLRERWQGRLVVKGVQRVEEAEAAVAAGADAVVVSNHGGRQLDRAATPLSVVGDVSRAVGDRADVIVDGGIMSGSDAVAALCLGADFVLVGRAYLYGLMAGGERGVDRVLDLFKAEMTNTMQLLGVTNLHELGPDLLEGAGEPGA
ncbi:alpha-hydroxy acid oxidase [Streptomyces sp. NPDC058665]|uniref:alpha-hydroxy acid oxidase n=1 Tax=Streptomyces sp. NPDC058665 TaxID=3346586 RepID=UPI00366731A8